MNFKILFVLLFIVQDCVNGIPLEHASDNLGRYFSPYIVGGSNAPDGYAPHVAALLAGEMVTIIACGGSIVLPNLILTAANCISYFKVPGGLHETFHAAVGANNWHYDGIVVQFKNFHIHPDWNPYEMKNDIGFLVLEDHLVLSKSVKLAALKFDWVDGGEPSFVTGWGRLSNWGMSPFHLQYLEVDTISSQQCIDDVRETAIWWGGAPEIDPAVEICTYNGVGKGLCHGDSGSALMSRKTGSQIGIASWAFTCAVGAPDMYTRISGFKDYIQEIMQKYQ